MSLLMDALRKAEEAKKQAEKAEQGQGQSGEEKAATPEPPHTQERQSAAQHSKPAADANVQLDINAPADDKQESSSPIPNVEIEFQQADEPAVSANPDPASLGQEPIKEQEKEEAKEEAQEETKAENNAETTQQNNQDTQTESTGENPAAKEVAQSAGGSDFSSLSLEPIDEGLSGATRRQFDKDVTPDYSMETAPVSATGSANFDVTSQRPGEQQRKPQASDQPAARVSNSGIAQSGTSDLHSSAQPSRATANVYGSEPVAKTASTSRPPQSKSPARPVAATKPKARNQTEPNPRLQPSPKKSSIREKSAPDRNSASKVFAAKKQGKRYRFRIRRSTRIWAAQIAAALVLMTGGAYYYYSTSGNSNSFNVPQEYLSNQNTYSDSFNEELTILEETVEETPTLDELAEMAAALSDVPALTEAVPAVEQITEVIGADSVISGLLANDNNPADSVANIAEVIDGISDTAALNSLDASTVAAAAQNNVANTETVIVQTATDNAEDVITTGSATSTDTVPVSVQPATESISFSRADSDDGIDPVLQNAYAAYQRDDLAVAQELYQQVLLESPLQRDALLGLAAIATRNGDSGLAMELYSRLLARDPSDGVARAGLLGMRPVGGPETQERELRRLLEQHPQVAPVVYALGNFYAIQNRWNEAQRHYFNALQLAKTDALMGVPVNPDYAFNLAVSLEQLNQPSAAENYYREAILFAADFPAGFDVSVARNRLQRLTGSNS